MWLVCEEEFLEQVTAEENSVIEDILTDQLIYCILDYILV